MIRRPALVLAALVVALGLPVVGAGPAAADIALPGVPIEEPSTDPRQPLPLEAGTYRDVLGPENGGDDVHHVLYTRTMRASTVYIGVTGANTEPYDKVQIDVRTPEGEECASNYSDSGSENGFGTFGAEVFIGPDEPNDGDSACLVADKLIASVSRGDSSIAGDLDVAIRIVEEAPTTSDVAELPAQAETPRADPPDVPDVEEVVGADTFEDAPYLDDGRFATSVTEGRQKFWRVRLGWGQQLSTSVRVPAADPATLEAVGGFGPNVELVLFDPLLNSFREVVDGAVVSADYDEEASTMRSGTSPIAYTNRYGNGVGVMPGDYWITVSVSAADDREPIDVPMEVAVQVTGEPGTDAPAFPATVQSPTGEAGPAGYAADTPFLVTPGTFAADVSGSPEPPESDEDDDASGGSGDSAAADDDTTRRVAGLGAGALGLACCAAGVLLLARRRRG